MSGDSPPGFHVVMTTGGRTYENTFAGFSPARAAKEVAFQAKKYAEEAEKKS